MKAGGSEIPRLRQFDDGHGREGVDFGFPKEVSTKPYKVLDDNACRGMTIANNATFRNWSQIDEQRHMRQIENEISSAIAEKHLTHAANTKMYHVDGIGSVPASEIQSNLGKLL